jgi:HEAT repeat protein
VAIAKLLKAPELSHRAHAARALGTVGAKGKSRVPDLVEMLQDKQRDGVLAAIWALANMKDGAMKAVPALTELAQRKETDEGVKQAALDAIDVINGKKK